MKILSFAASNSRKSINKALVQYAIEKLNQEDLNLEIELIDLNDFEMPIYSIDREKESGIPDKAHQFYNKISQADALIISYAEHNGLFTSAYKNIFDWSSRIQMKVYQDKPMVIFSTSIGKNGGANVLKTALEAAPHFGAKVKASLSIPLFQKNFDLESGKITNPDLDQKFHSVLKHLF